MKTISQTLIMSWLGKNYQWAMVEGSSGLSALGEGGILKGIKLYSKIMQVFSSFITLPSSSTFGFPLTASICPYALL
jgi:hypothetical protein